MVDSSCVTVDRFCLKPLTVNQNIIGFKKFHDMAMYNMFQDFACDARKRDRSIIPALLFLFFFEYSMYVGFFPFGW